MGKKRKRKKQDEPQVTILIVEDDLTLLEILEYGLAVEGYQTITGADGGQPWRLLGSNSRSRSCTTSCSQNRLVLKCTGSSAAR
jgi:hypothetical protein